jgi:hypothetical protein
MGLYGVIHQCSKVTASNRISLLLLLLVLVLVLLQ